MKKRPEYIVVRDSFWIGVLGDLIMYGIMLGLYYFNYHYLGNNGVLNIIFTALVIGSIVSIFSGKYKREFYSYDAVIDYLKSKSTDDNQAKE